MLFYLGHPSYYSDEIRWSRRFVDVVLLGTPVILLWWNQVVQEVCRCCLTWDPRHNTLMKSGGPGGGPADFIRVIWRVSQVKQHLQTSWTTWFHESNMTGVPSKTGGLQMLFYLGHPSYYSDEIRWSRRFTDAVLLGTPVILLWWNQVVQEVCRCCFTWDTRHITLMKSGVIWRVSQVKQHL
jgi:hypothetical protein